MSQEPVTDLEYKVARSDHATALRRLRESCLELTRNLGEIVTLAEGLSAATDLADQAGAVLERRADEADARLARNWAKAGPAPTKAERVAAFIQAASDEMGVDLSDAPDHVVARAMRALDHRLKADRLPPSERLAVARMTAEGGGTALIDTEVA